MSSSVSPLVILLTGATGSIGSSIARTLSSLGHTLILPVRSIPTTSSHLLALPSSSTHFEQVDLASRTSVASLIDRVNKKYPIVNVLINNAASTGTEKKRTVTIDGFEIQWHINVLSYYQLLTGLYPLLSRSSTPLQHSRIVNVASNYAGGLDLSDTQFEKRGVDLTSGYRASKQANRMMSLYAHRFYNQNRIEGKGVVVSSGIVDINACHPGVVTSRVLSSLGMVEGFESADEGAATPVFLAVDKRIEGKSGKYWVKSKEANEQFARDEEAQQQLWKILEVNLKQ